MEKILNELQNLISSRGFKSIKYSPWHWNLMFFPNTGTSVDSPKQLSKIISPMTILVSDYQREIIFSEVILSN